MSTNNQNNNNKNNNSIQLGAGWERVNKKGNEYISLRFNGSRDKDEYEVVVRQKSTGQELALHETAVILQRNAKKKSEDSPDFYLTTFYGGDNNS